MKRLSQSEYKKRKSLKQSIKSIPEKETNNPLLRSTIIMNNPFLTDSLMEMAFPMLMLAKMAMKRRRRFDLQRTNRILP